MILFNNEILINLIIGFFYSMLIGILIYYITEKFRNLNEIENHMVLIEKYELFSSSLYAELMELKHINYKRYLDLIYDILLNKEIDIDEYEDVDNVIIFKRIPRAPEISPYLAYISMLEADKELLEIYKQIDMDKFDLENLENNFSEFKRFHKEFSEKIKEMNLNDKLFKGCGGISFYTHLNINIDRLNNILDYYREYLKIILSINSELSLKQTDLIKRQFRTFQYIVNKIKLAVEEILVERNNLDKVMSEAKSRLEKKQIKIKVSIRIIYITLFILLIASIVFLYLAVKYSI